MVRTAFVPFTQYCATTVSPCGRGSSKFAATRLLTSPSQHGFLARRTLHSCPLVLRVWYPVAAGQSFRFVGVGCPQTAHYSTPVPYDNHSWSTGYLPHGTVLLTASVSPAERLPTESLVCIRCCHPTQLGMTSCLCTLPQCYTGAVVADHGSLWTTSFLPKQRESTSHHSTSSRLAWPAPCSCL